MKQKMILLFTWVLCCLTIHNALAQEQKPVLDVAYQHVVMMADEWGLQTTDYTDMIVSDQYVAKHIGVTHIYFVQRHASIPVFGSINGVHIDRDGKVAFATNTFQANLAERVNATSPIITAEQALEAALNNLGLRASQGIHLKAQSGQHYTFSGGSFAHNDIEVKPRYMPMGETGEIRLAWDMAIDVVGSSDYWSIRIDALNGSLLHKNNWTISCTFNKEGGFLKHTDHCAHQEEKGTANFFTINKNTEIIVGDQAAYNVFPIPIESPLHGERTLVQEPADEISSPFGWHDIDGIEGPEYTYTRGNNVHAFLDLAGNNSSQGDEPDGGEDLLFNFPFDINNEPAEMQEADITQLFYMCNMMHDITYAYGFNEEGGNFQRTNYTGEGTGLDHVIADGQDGSGTNNANFSTPPDGSNGRMQMFLWNGVAGRLLNIDAPEGIQGSYETGSASYGPQVPETPIVAQIVRAYDETDSPFIVCESVANGDQVNGKIALIDRGFCFFEAKTLNAQAAGAVAVIICNYEESAPGMSGGVEGDEPTIPTISLKASDCAQIKMKLDQDQIVMASIGQPEDNGPDAVSSSFDNGIVAHEYGHGISNRMTGGPSNDGCLFNAEQMGEGWSDFFALITSVRPGDTGATARGTGNYSARNDVTGGGIRRRPYSTDMTINDHTYDRIMGVGGETHDVGEVWTTMIWDLFWAFVDEYGYDEDLINGTGGNNMAIQIIMDGMAFQTCNPGFVSGRDALFTADFLNYDGIHECLIWEVFARRGLGFEASEGSRFSTEDGTPDFNTLPECIKELKIRKTANKNLVVSGENIVFELRISNHKETAVTDVVVEDELPGGLTYVPGSSSIANVSDNGNSLIFNAGNIDAGDDMVITYEVSTDPGKHSIRQYYDGMEDGFGDNNWDLGVETGVDIWEINTSNAHSGNQCWFIRNSQAQNDQRIEMLESFTVSGDAPALRFYHDYDTQPVNDGGLVQISTDGGSSWSFLNTTFLRNDYRGDLAARTLFAPNIETFWGDSREYIDTYLDLSEYIGQDIKIRFRFVSDTDNENNPFIGAVGWFMDDFEILDMKAYEGEACINSAEGDMACAVMPENGVIIDTDIINATAEPTHRPDILQVYPNPVKNTMNIGLTGEFYDNVSVSLINIGGAVIRQWDNKSLTGQYLSLDINSIPAGFYVIKVSTQKGIFTEKVTIQ